MTERLMRWPHGTPAELLQMFREHNEAIGRTVCPVCDYVAAHLDDKIEDVEAYIFTDPDLAPGLICDGLFGCVFWMNDARNSLEQAQADQEALTVALAAIPYARARADLEALMKRRSMRFLSRTALETVLAYVRAGHPNPKAFLAKPDVLEKIPADVDLTDYLCPDFPDLTKTPLHGAAKQ